MREFLHTKYRPKVFEDVVGQDYTVKILKKQVEEGTFKNCYLLTGPAGCSKTTLGRILANEINKGQGSPIEVDAASNNGVAEVGFIIEQSNVQSMDSYYKVFIIDECHMLSTGAWNKFLKTIEEPPPRSIFIFCTTDVQKVPPTILSRVQRYDIKRIPLPLIVKRLEYICKQEKFSFEQDALDYMGKLAEGGMRDAITLLDKASSYNKDITLLNVINALGVANYEVMFKLTNYIIDYKELECLSLINEMFENGKDLKLFLNEYIYFILDVVKYLIKPSFDNIKIPVIYKKELDVLMNGVERSFYNKILYALVDMRDNMRWETQIKPNLELNILKLCRS